MASSKKYRINWIVLWILLVCFGMGTLMATPRKMDGAFIGIYQGDKKAWSTERWRKELEYLHYVGMDTVIISTAVYNTTAFYPNCSISGTTTLDTTLTRILDITDSLGMSVIIGLYGESSSWSVNGQTPSYLTKLNNNSKKVADDLWSLYGSRTSFKGWYIQQEIDNLNWQTETDRTNLVQYYFRPISDYCRAKNTTKWVCEANFFNDNLQSAADYGTWWKKTLADCTSLNLLIPQDGIGADHATYTTVSSYFNALRTACTTYNRLMWADIEAYESISNQGPTTIGRLTTQINVVSSYVSGITNWEYYSCLSPLNTLSTMSLYNKYDEYANGTNLSKGRSYTVSPTPHTSYPDSGGELTDTVYPYTWASQVGWTSPVTNPTIIVDLGQVQNSIGEVRGYCMRSDGSGVYTPQTLSVYGSTDGTNYTYYGDATPLSANNQFVNSYRLRALNFSAQYVKVVINPDSRNAWSMINEVTVLQGSGVVPVELSAFEVDSE